VYFTSKVSSALDRNALDIYFRVNSFVVESSTLDFNGFLFGSSSSVLSEKTLMVSLAFHSYMRVNFFALKITPLLRVGLEEMQEVV